MTDAIYDDEDFVPAKNAGGGGGNFEQRNYPVPKAGARRARVSLIVDIGIQDQDDSYKLADGTMCNEDTPGAIATPRKPSSQVVVFADLVNDTVDYGGEIGKAHYRLMLNGSYSGVIKGVNHAINNPPKDAKGKMIKGGVWTMHPQNLLTKLAKATNTEEIIASGAINRLLNKQFMAQVEVKETASGKDDADGNEIIYKNVNYKSASQVAAVETDDLDDNGDPIEAIPEFNALKVKPMCITFKNAKKEDIKIIRANILKMIKLANNYAGSNMQKAIEAFEADKESGGSKNDDDVGEDDNEPTPAPKETPKPVPKKSAKAPVEEPEEDDDSSPF